MKFVHLEFFKMKRKHLFFMITLLMVIEIGWAVIATGMAISRNPGMVGWKDIIMTIASMNGLFLPIICAVVVSRICDMENKGNTWKLLISASIKTSRIYVAKFISACFLLLYASALQVFAISIFGIVNEFQESVPFFQLLKFLGGTMLTNIVIIALQQWISLAVKNQSFALCIGMIGGFIGMTANLFPSIVRKPLIWSYYTGFCPVTYNFTNDSMDFVTQNIEKHSIILVVLIGIVVYVAGSSHVSRKEV